MLTVKKPSKNTTAVAVEQQKKVSHKVKSGALTEDQRLVDRVVEIDTELKQANAFDLLKELEEKKKGLQSIAKTFPVTEEATIAGSIGEVVYSPCRREVQVIDKEGLIKKLGQKLFNEIAKVSLTDLQKYLSENEIEHFTSVSYGSRSLKTVKKYDD
jgi:hypothetical protein